MVGRCVMNHDTLQNNSRPSKVRVHYNRRAPTYRQNPADRGPHDLSEGCFAALPSALASSEAQHLPRRFLVTGCHWMSLVNQMDLRVRSMPCIHAIAQDSSRCPALDTTALNLPESPNAPGKRRLHSALVAFWTWT